MTNNNCKGRGGDLDGKERRKKVTLTQFRLDCRRLTIAEVADSALWQSGCSDVNSIQSISPIHLLDVRGHAKSELTRTRLVVKIPFAKLESFCELMSFVYGKPNQWDNIIGMGVKREDKEFFEMQQLVLNRRMICVMRNVRCVYFILQIVWVAFYVWRRFVLLADDGMDSELVLSNTKFMWQSTNFYRLEVRSSPLFLLLVNTFIPSEAVLSWCLRVNGELKSRSNSKEKCYGEETEVYQS